MTVSIIDGKSGRGGNLQGGARLKFPFPECEVPMGHLDGNVQQIGREGFLGSGQGEDRRERDRATSLSGEGTAKDSWSEAPGADGSEDLYLLGRSEVKGECSIGGGGHMET